MATYKEAIENKLNTWYKTLGRKELSLIYGMDDPDSDTINLWYNMSIDDKLNIYDESEK
jgi:hypothetical protein